MKKLFSILLIVFFLAGSSEIAFSGRGGSSSSEGHSSSSFSGGSRSSASSSGGSKSFSGSGSSSGKSSSGSGTRDSGKTFSGSDSSKSVTQSSRPGFDSAAGKAQSKETSARSYSSWKESHGIVNKTYSKEMASTRVEREKVFTTRQPTGYYSPPTTVVVYRDFYNNNFLTYASMFWLFNHWDSVDHSRFQDAKIKELEAKFKELEAKGTKKDPNYVEAGIDPDLQYNKDAAGYKSGMSGWLIFFIILGIIALILVCIWYVFIKRVRY